MLFRTVAPTYTPIISDPLSYTTANLVYHLPWKYLSIIWVKGSLLLS